MRGKIISYTEMCANEGGSLQRGMNYRLRGGASVILMSLRKNSPYQDAVEDNGTTIIYEGHDVPRNVHSSPKTVDQPYYREGGSLTENGKFSEAAKKYKRGVAAPEIIHVYEKVKTGIWTDNGFFELADVWMESDGTREVFKFKLTISDGENENSDLESGGKLSPGRLIPPTVKLEVFKRDEGKCVLCGEENELHFDHIIPVTKGGTSSTAENIQLLCARHNRQKSAKII